MAVTSPVLDDGDESATPSPRLPGEAGARGTRRRLLESAVVLFAQRGYHGVSVRDITGAVGVKASSLYAHFASKEDLFAELLEMGHASHIGVLRDALQVTSSEPPVEQLRAVVGAHVKVLAAYPHLSRVCAEDVHGLDAGLLRQVLSRQIELTSLVLTVLADGIDRGEFDPVEPFPTAVAILSSSMRVPNWFSHATAGLELFGTSDAAMQSLPSYDADEIAAVYADLAIRMVIRR